jgi:membrane protein
MIEEKLSPEARRRLSRLRPAWDFLAETYDEWSKDNAMTLGAALAFYTTFSLAPLLIIIIAIFGMFIGEQAIQAEILRRVHELIGPQGAAAVKMMIQDAYRPGSGWAATIIGVAVILFGSTSAFVMLKQALNIMWGAKPHPASSVWFVVKERLMSFLMIMLIGLLLILSFTFSIVLSFLTGFFQHLLPVPPSLIQLADFFVSFLLVTLLFALIYKVLPDVDIAWKDVWIGSMVTAVLFSLGKFLFGMYLGRSSITSAYGAASSLAIILMWVYYSTQVFFIGVELTQVYANRYGSRVKPRN